jgi:TolA-binding protein
MNKFVLTFIILLMALYMGYGQKYGESDDFSYALKLYNEGFFDIAAQQFTLFVNRYPSSDRVPEAKYYLGLSLYEAMDYENARIEFQSMAVSFPEHSRAPESWQRVGKAYLNLNKPEEAARAFETVKILYPKDPLASVSLFQAAKIYFEEKNLDKAELVLKDFLDRYPDSEDYPKGRLLFANILLERKNFDQAFMEYQKVLTSGAEPQILAEAYLVTKYSKTAANFTAILKYSEILAITEEYQTASRVINDNSNRYKSSQEKAQLNLMLSAVYYLQGDYFAARRVLESTSLTGLPDDLKNKLNFYLANCYFKEDKLNQSLQHFEKISKLENTESVEPDYLAETNKKIGYIYLKLGNFEQGAGQLRDYVNNYPADPGIEKIYADLFEIALRNDNPEDAEGLYKELLMKVPDYSYRDEILFSLVKNQFNKGEYEFAYNRLKTFLREYRCSAKYDSARFYLSLLKNNYLVGQDVGINKLARLVGRVLAQEDKEKLKLELAKVNLFQLKDREEAMRLSRAIIQTSSDSAILGEAYHILGESYRKEAEINRFLGKSYNTEIAHAIDALKKAMIYLDHIEQPDSLSYVFLSETAGLGAEQIPAEKKVQFWQHFKSNYPNSQFKDRVSMILSKLYEQAGNSALALQELIGLTASKDFEVAGDAYYAMGRVYFEQKELAKAAQVLKNFLLNISDHHMRANAFGILAKINEKQDNFAEAAQFWSRLRKEYNYSSAATAAESQIPEVFLMAKEYEAVLDYTEPYIQTQISQDLILRKLQFIPELNYYFYNGKAHYHLNNYSQSRKFLLDYLYNNRDKKFYDETLFLMAEICTKERDANGALLHLEMIARNENSPFFLQATMRIADIYFEQQKYGKAQSLYANLISRIKDTDQMVIFKVKEMICLINQGKLKQFDNKLSAFKSAHKKDPEINNYLSRFQFEVGKYYYQNKNFDTAIKKFDTVRKKYKKSDYADDAEYYLGLTYSTLNKVDQAMQVLSSFAEKYPNSPMKSNIYVTLGGLYYRAEKRELAVGSFQKAVETAQEPETRKLALSNLIILYRDLGLWDGVLSQAKIYVQEFPEAEDIIDKKIMLGTAMTNLNRYSEAVDYLKNLKFQANSEQEPEIQFYIGEAYFNAGQYENAIREFVKIPLLSKQTKLQWEASALYYSGQAYEKMGRIPDAIRMYQEIIERPGILVELKKEARKRIEQLKSSG